MPVRIIADEKDIHPIKNIDVFRLMFFLLIFLFLWLQFFIPGIPSFVDKMIFLISIVILLLRLFAGGGNCTFPGDLRDI